MTTPEHAITAVNGKGEMRFITAEKAGDQTVVRIRKPDGTQVTQLTMSVDSAEEFGDVLLRSDELEAALRS